MSWLCPYPRVPRKPRQEEAGAINHVVARGNNRHRTYVDDTDRQRYLALLAEVVRRQGWNCLAFCLMPNHMHLLVETPYPNLGEGLHALQGRYARAFNERHDRVGHVFQGRYRPTRVVSERQLHATVGYIALNPVSAGMCATPEEWPWSSHWAISTGDVPSWLGVSRLFELLDYGGDPATVYAEAVAARLEMATS